MFLKMSKDRNLSYLVLIGFDPQSPDPWSVLDMLKTVLVSTSWSKMICFEGKFHPVAILDVKLRPSRMKVIKKKLFSCLVPSSSSSSWKIYSKYNQGQIWINVQLVVLYHLYPLKKALNFPILWRIISVHCHGLTPSLKICTFNMLLLVF